MRGQSHDDAGAATDSQDEADVGPHEQEEEHDPMHELLRLADVACEDEDAAPAPAPAPAPAALPLPPAAADDVQWEAEVDVQHQSVALLTTHAAQPPQSMSTQRSLPARQLLLPLRARGTAADVGPHEQEEGHDPMHGLLRLADVACEDEDDDAAPAPAATPAAAPAAADDVQWEAEMDVQHQSVALLTTHTAQPPQSMSTQRSLPARQPARLLPRARGTAANPGSRPYRKWVSD